MANFLPELHQVYKLVDLLYLDEEEARSGYLTDRTSIRNVDAFDELTYSITPADLRNVRGCKGFAPRFFHFKQHTNDRWFVSFNTELDMNLPAGVEVDPIDFFEVDIVNSYLFRFKDIEQYRRSNPSTPLREYFNKSFYNLGIKRKFSDRYKTPVIAVDASASFYKFNWTWKNGEGMGCYIAYKSLGYDGIYEIFNNRLQPFLYRQEFCCWNNLYENCLKDSI